MSSSPSSSSSKSAIEENREHDFEIANAPCPVQELTPSQAVLSSTIGDDMLVSSPHVKPTRLEEISASLLEPSLCKNLYWFPRSAPVLANVKDFRCLRLFQIFNCKKKARVLLMETLTNLFLYNFDTLAYRPQRHGGCNVPKIRK